MLRTTVPFISFPSSCLLSWISPWQRRLSGKDLACEVTAVHSNLVISNVVYTVAEEGEKVDPCGTLWKRNMPFLITALYQKPCLN